MSEDTEKRERLVALDPRARNPVTHGLSASHVLETEQAEYDLALADLIEEHHPLGPVENALCKRMARLSVRLNRAGRVEAEAYAACFEVGAQGQIELNHLLFKQLVETIGRYELSMGRALAKTQHELERMLAKRQGENVCLPAIVDFNW